MTVAPCLHAVRGTLEAGSLRSRDVSGRPTGPCAPAYERRLISAAQRDGPWRLNTDALTFEQFRPMIASVARLYKGCPAVDHAELMQEGMVGLLRALERFDPALRTPFWAYASWWVRQAMQRLVAELGQPVVLSDRALRQLAQVKEARRDLQQSSGSEPSTGRLATTTGLKREQVDHLIAVERAPRALDEPVKGPETGAPRWASRSQTPWPRTPTTMWTPGQTPRSGGRSCTGSTRANAASCGHASASTGTRTR